MYTILRNKTCFKTLYTKGCREDRKRENHGSLHPQNFANMYTGDCFSMNPAFSSNMPRSLQQMNKRTGKHEPLSLVSPLFG